LAGNPNNTTMSITRDWLFRLGASDCTERQTLGCVLAYRHWLLRSESCSAAVCGLQGCNPVQLL